MKVKAGLKGSADPATTFSPVGNSPAIIFNEKIIIFKKIKNLFI